MICKTRFFSKGHHKGGGEFYISIQISVCVCVYTHEKLLGNESFSLHSPIHLPYIEHSYNQSLALCLLFFHPTFDDTEEVLSDYTLRFPIPFPHLVMLSSHALGDPDDRS